MVFSPSGEGEVTLDINAEDNASDSIDGIAGSLGSMRGAAAAAGTALAAIGIGGLTAATGAAIDFEEAMVEVEKVTSSAMSENLEDDIRGIAEATRLTHGEVANLAAQAARFGAEGEEEIANFTETAAKMGAATTLASDEAGKALAKMSTALGVPLSEVERLGDATNELSNNYAADSAEIVDAATRSGQALQSMGMSEEQILGLSAAMNEVTPSSSKAATMMRKVSQAMMDPKRTEALANALGVTKEEFINMREESPAETMQALGEVMAEGGEKATMLSTELTTRQVRAFRRVGSQAEELAGTYDMANRAMEEGGSLAAENEADISTLAGQMDILSSRLTTAAQKIGEQLVPVLVDAIDAVMPLIDAFIVLNDKTNGMAGVVALVGTTVAGLATAFAAVAPVIAGLIPSIGAITGALGTAASAVGTVVAVLGGPLTLAIVGIIALIGTLWYAWNNNIGNIQGKVESFVSSIKNSFGIISKELGEFADIFRNAFSSSGDEASKFGGIIDRVSSAVGTVVEVMSNTVGAALEHIADVVNWLVVNHYEPMMNRLQKLTETHLGPMVDEFIETFNVVMDRLEGFVNFALGIWRKFTGVALDLWERYGDQILAVIRPVLKVLRLIITQAFDAILTTIRVALALIRGDWSDAWDIIEAYLDRTLGRIEEAFKAFKQYFEAAWDLLTTVIEDVWNATWDAVKSTVQDIFNSIVTWMKNTGKKIIRGATEAVTSVILEPFENLYDTLIGNSLIPDMIGDIASFFRGAAKSILKGAMATMMGGMMSVVSSFKEDVLDTMGDVASGIKETISNAVSDAADSAQSSIDDITSSLDSAINSALDGAEDAVNDAIDDAQDAIDNAASTGSRWYNTTRSNASDTVTNIIDTGSNFVDDAVDTGSEVVDNVTETGSDWASDFIDTGSSWAGGVADTIDDTIGTIGNTVNNVVDTGRSWMDDAVDTGSSWASDASNAVSNAADRITNAADRVGGFFGFANGGIVTSPVMGMIGETGKTEAVVPLDRLSSMMDTTYEAGASGGSQSVDVSIRVEGDDELARMIRENAEVVVEQDNQDKRDRLRRV